MTSNNKLRLINELKGLDDEKSKLYNKVLKSTSMRDTLLYLDELDYIESEITKIQRKLGALK